MYCYRQISHGERCKNEDNKNKEMITYACTQDTKILKESNNDKKIFDGVIVDFAMYEMTFELYFLTKIITLLFR